MNHTTNTVEQLVEQYLIYCQTSKRLSPDSIKAYRIDLSQFIAFLKKHHPGLCDVTQVDRAILQEFIMCINQEFRVKSVKRKIACLKGFFTYAEEEDVIEGTPFLKLRFKIKEPICLPAVMSLREVKRILTAAYTDQYPQSTFLYHRDIAVLELFFASGLRVHELCNLRHKDMNANQSSIRVIGKGNKERRIYVGNKEVLTALNRYSQQVKAQRFRSEHIFLNKHGNKLSTQAARNIVTKYTHLAGISQNITPHAFRHTFATLLLEEGVDIKYIQEFLGHSSISTTQIYLHVSAKSCRNILTNKHPRKKLSFNEMT